MMRKQFTNDPSNPLYLACQVMKRALEYYSAMEHYGGVRGLLPGIAEQAVRKAESVAGTRFDISPPWLDEWIGLGAPVQEDSSHG